MEGFSEYQQKQFDKIRDCLAATYILQTAAMSFVDDLNQIAVESNMFKQQIKYHSNNLERAFQTYCKAFEPLLDKKSSGEMILRISDKLCSDINAAITKDLGLKVRE